MNDKTEQTVVDALRLTAKLAASYLTEAADTIENLREQLAEAQRDAARWGWAAQCARLDQFGGFVVTPDEPAFAPDVSLAFTREIDAAINNAAQSRHRRGEGREKWSLK